MHSSSVVVYHSNSLELNPQIPLKISKKKIKNLKLYKYMTVDPNSRILYEFCIGIPNDEELFKNAVFEITEELTKLTDGLTYEYAYGTWKKDNTSQIERNFTVRIYTIVLPEIANDVYLSAKDIIAAVNKKYNLGIIHVQVMKTIGYAQHFHIL
jgi:hypothetical protein